MLYHASINQFLKSLVQITENYAGCRGVANRVQYCVPDPPEYPTSGVRSVVGSELDAFDDLSLRVCLLNVFTEKRHDEPLFGAQRIVVLIPYILGSRSALPLLCFDRH